MEIKNIFISFLTGFLFAVGLVLSGMTQPSKVIGFLDLFGNWDPSLIFVMVGGITVHALYFFAIKPRFKKPVFSSAYQVPTKTIITKPLILGSVLFGIGWALGGYCPGPAIASLSTLTMEPLLFVGAMLLGMLLNRILIPKNTVL